MGLKCPKQESMELGNIPEGVESHLLRERVIVLIDVWYMSAVYFKAPYSFTSKLLLFKNDNLGTPLLWRLQILQHSA